MIPGQTPDLCREENAVDENTRQMHELVKFVKIRPEVEVELMTWGEYIDSERMDQAEETRREVTKSTKISSIIELLEEYGEVSQEVIGSLQKIDDMQELSRLLKLSAKVNSIEDFEKGLSPI